MQSKTIRDGLLLLVLWCVGVLAVGWRGDFPLNDDWSYGLTVKHWLETGTFHPESWTSMTLWTHAAWGALFSKVGGFSFETLRLSMLSMGALGMMAVYGLIRQVGGTSPKALLAAILVGFNPVFFDLSFTFMTDVTFSTMVAWAALFIVRHTQSGGMADWSLAMVFSLAAILCRQLGLCLVLGLSLGMLLRRGWRPTSLLLAALPIAIGVASLLGFTHWLAQTGRTPSLYHLKEQELQDVLAHPLAMASTFGRNVVLAVIYLGLFLCPALLAWRTRGAAAALPPKQTLAARLAGVLMLIGLLGIMVAGKRLMPVWGNTLTQYGLGPLLLHDIIHLSLPNVERQPAWWWAIMTAATAIGTYLLATWATSTTMALPSFFRQPPQQGGAASVRLVLLATACAYIAPLLVMPDFFDRYLLVMLPLMLAALAASTDGTSPRAPAPWAQAGAWSVAFYLAFLAVAGTHDHLAWSRARWQAIGFAETSQKATPADMDGGFEYNGYHLYADAYQRQPDKSWWWVHKDDYIIAFKPLPDTAVLARFPYHRWLPAQDGSVVLLKRQSTSPPGATHP